jgi:predicted negative regulator of RcsB-dependent stress response
MEKQKKNQVTPSMEESLNQSEAFFLKYKNAIVGGVIALIVIIGCAMWFKSYSAGKQEEASTAMAKAQENFQNRNYELALNGDSTGTVGFLKIASEFGSTDAGNLAYLYAGLCYANMDKWEEAAQYLEKFDAANDKMVSPAALGALGNTYAHLNQFDKAVSTLIKAAEKAYAAEEAAYNKLIDEAGDALSEVEGLCRHKIKTVLILTLLRMFEVSITVPQFDLVVLSLMTIINIIQNKMLY